MSEKILILSGNLEHITFARELLGDEILYASDLNFLKRILEHETLSLAYIHSDFFSPELESFLQNQGCHYRVFHSSLDLEKSLAEKSAGKDGQENSSGNLSFSEDAFAELSPSFSLLAGTSRQMQQLRQTILKIAAFDVSVLILGETGTGKTTVARAIHELSARRKKIFKEVVLSTMNESLIESKLFGVAEGGFTGAVAGKGVFEEADGGTLFFDEIGEISANVQTKILQVLSEGVINRIGSNKDIRVDNRMIFATNANLDMKIRTKEFREDLLYRINDVTIRIPPLRERLEDIPALARCFLKRSKINKEISGPALAALQTFSWKGNVRQLEKVLKNAALLYCDGDVIEPEHIRF